jgi:hypothetical protein
LIYQFDENVKKHPNLAFALNCALHDIQQKSNYYFEKVYVESMGNIITKLESYRTSSTSGFLVSKHEIMCQLYFVNWICYVNAETFIALVLVAY